MSFEVDPLLQMREEFLEQRLAPCWRSASWPLPDVMSRSASRVGVANVTQRNARIGLRRAKGAPARRIHRQILGELW